MGGKHQAVDPAGDSIVEKFDLVADVGFGGGIGGHFEFHAGLREVVGSGFDSFAGGVEISNADHLRHIGDDDLLAFEILWVDGLTAIVVGRSGHARKGKADGGDSAQPGGGPMLHDLGNVLHGCFIYLTVWGEFFGALKAGPCLAPGRRSRNWPRIIDRMSTIPITITLASPRTPES